MSEPVTWRFWEDPPSEYLPVIQAYLASEAWTDQLRNAVRDDLVWFKERQRFQALADFLDELSSVLPPINVYRSMRKEVYDPWHPGNVVVAEAEGTIGPSIIDTIINRSMPGGPQIVTLMYSHADYFLPRQRVFYTLYRKAATRPELYPDRPEFIGYEAAVEEAERLQASSSEGSIQIMPLEVLLQSHRQGIGQGSWDHWVDQFEKMVEVLQPGLTESGDLTALAAFEQRLYEADREYKVQVERATVEMIPKQLRILSALTDRLRELNPQLLQLVPVIVCDDQDCPSQYKDRRPKRAICYDTQKKEVVVLSVGSYAGLTAFQYLRYLLGWIKFESPTNAEWRYSPESIARKLLEASLPKATVASILEMNMGKRQVDLSTW